MMWLDPIFEGLGPLAPVLVLCASGSASSLVRREAARRGGALGLTILTPLGLARTVAKALGRERRADVPPSALVGELGDQVQGRPGLARTLRDHVDRALRLRLGEDGITTGDARLDEILEAKPNPSSATRELAELVHAAAAAKDGVVAGQFYRRVFAIGFGRQEGVPAVSTVDEFDGRLLRALKAQRLSAPPQREGVVTITVTPANDVVGEARWVAERVANFKGRLGDVNRVLVLVPSSADADRIRGALTRSGLASADDGGRPLREHALGALLGRLLPWFSSREDPEIEGEDLRLLLQSRLLKHAWREKLAARKNELVVRLRAVMDVPSDPADVATPPTEHEILALSRSAIPAVLRAAHLVRAPASRWIQALEDAAKEASLGAWKQRQAMVIAERLRLLIECRGTGATLGQLRAFVFGFGVKTWLPEGPDLVGSSILGALAKAGDLPAREDTLADILDGGVGAGVLHKGVVLLPYDAYDGRDCDLLLLTGLHAKGFGRAPEPDAFFAAEVLAKLGLRSGSAALDHRERLLQAAVRRARESEACAPSAAADGRASAPYLLILAGEVEGARDGEPGATPGVVLRKAGGGAAVKSYGLELAGCPEVIDFGRLQRTGQAPASERADATTMAGHLATMASVEWVRAGAHVDGFVRPKGEAGEMLTLTNVVDRYAPAVPAWARPWMGDTSGSSHERVRLDPARNMSLSSSIEALTHCGYQAFAGIQLRLREAEVLEEELDAKEVGKVAHAALEDVAESTSWRTPADQREGAVQSLTSQLTAAMASRVDGLGEPATHALREAQEGLVSRWAVHWAKYVAARVKVLDPEGAARKAAVLAVGDGAAASALAADAAAHCSMNGWGPKDVEETIRKGVILSLPGLAAGIQFSAAEPPAPVNPKGWKVLLPWLSQPDRSDQLAVLVAEYQTAFAKELPAHGPILGGFSEWAFGRSFKRPEAEERWIELDGVRMQVNGDIDLVRATGTATAWDAWVIDFKSWKSAKKRSEVVPDMAKGLKVQVPLYALVLRQAQAEGWQPEGTAGPPVSWHLVYDGLRDPKKGEHEVRDGEEGVSLRTIEVLIGSSVQRARGGDWLAVPHEDSCPALNERVHDYCKFQDVCRLRAMPGGAARVADAEANDEQEGDVAK